MLSRKPLAALAASAALLVPFPALAHTGVDHGHSLVQGLAHPVGGPDHLLAMVAVGLLAARFGGRSLWALPALFLGGMLAGGLMGMAGLALPAVEPGILASVVLLGTLLCLAPQALAPAGMLLAGLSGLFHGYAHGAEMPAAGSALTYGLGFLLSTATLHGLGVLAVLGLQEKLARPAAATAVRVAGLAIGVAGVGLAVA